MRHAPVLLCALGPLLLACGASDDRTGQEPSTGDPNAPSNPYNPYLPPGDTGVPPAGTTTPPPGTGTSPVGTVAPPPTGTVAPPPTGTVAPPPTGTVAPPPDPNVNGCNLHTQYPGDEYCILPPAPGEGIQLHVGPADYDDPTAVANFVAQPGEENVRCFATPVSEAGFHYLRQQNRMRSGSHHMLIDLAPAGQGCSQVGRVAALPGSQTPARDFPSDDFGPEDAGIARYVPPTAAEAGFQLHYVNTSDQPVLREAWINLYKMPESEVTQPLQDIFLVGDLAANIPAHSKQTTTLTFKPAITESTRIFNLSAHSHAHDEVFSVYRVRGGQEELVYQSFDWEEPDELTYNTVNQNPPPDPVAKTDGGYSGMLYFEPGDSFKWTCEVNNTTDAALRFANEAFTAEMCLLPGGYISQTGGLMAGACFAGSCRAGFF